MQTEKQQVMKVIRFHSFLTPAGHMIVMIFVNIKETLAGHSMLSASIWLCFLPHPQKNVCISAYLAACLHPLSLLVLPPPPPAAWISSLRFVIEITGSPPNQRKDEEAEGART